MKNISKLIEIIKRETESKVKTDYIFLGYYTLYMYKLLLNMYNPEIKEKDFYKYFYRTLKHTDDKNSFIINNGKNEIILKNSFKLGGALDVLAGVDMILDHFKKTLTQKQYDKIKYNWESLGLIQFKKELKTNRNGLEKVIKAYDEIDHLGIEDLINIYEKLNVSDRTYNDFFTPPDISIFASKLMVQKYIDNNKNNKKEVNFCDIACGCGRLLYYGMIELKNNGIDNIRIFGNDIYEPVCVFTKSILELVNFGKVHIFQSDALTSKLPLPKMDILLGNPPFGGSYDKDKILNLSRYKKENMGMDIQFENIDLLRLKKLTPLNDIEYTAIEKNYREI